MSKRQTYSVADLHFIVVLHSTGKNVPNIVSQGVSVKTNESKNKSH